MAIEAEELAVISRSIRNAGVETAGEFRQAANASNANLSRIVKDISTTFKAQREDIADLHNVLEEMVSESQQTGNKIDSLNSLFRESLEIQNSMRTEMSNVTKNTRILSGDIESLNRNIMNNTSSGLLGSISNLSTDFAKQLALMGVGAAVAGGGMTALGAMGGGGLGRQEVKEGSGSGYEQSGLSRQNVADMIRKSAIQRGIDPETAVGIAKSEGLNTYRSSAPGKKWGMEREPSYGPFQLLVGKGTGGPEGLGDRFKAATGIDPATDRSAASLQKQIDFALDEAKKKGWGQWYGRKTAGIGEFQGINVDTSKMKAPEISTTPQTTTPTTTPSATPVSAPEAIPSGNDPRTERIGKEGGHGPVSGAAHEDHKHGEQVSASLPSGDVVALGHALEKMGMRISEHPQFGGVKPVHKGKAHYEGRAIDINFGEGNVEAKDPVMGAKFDQLAEQLTRLGYKVYWRESGPYAAAGHNNHLHAEIPKGGAQSVPDTYQIAGSPEQRAMQGATPAAGSTASTAPPAATPMAAEPVAQAPISPGIAAPPAGANMMGQMMGMIPGMMGGGIGGIAGMLLPMIASTIQSELVSTPSMPALNAQALNQAAVTSQATEQTVQEAQVSSHTPQVNAEPNRMHNSNQAGFAYNMPGDIEWPDWAGMLGGNHYEEMNLFKPRMSRG